MRRRWVLRVGPLVLFRFRAVHSDQLGVARVGPVAVCRFRRTSRREGN